MKKRILIAVLIVLSIALIAVGVRVESPLREARQSCRVFRMFTEHVARAEWSQAQAMLKTDPDHFFRIEDDKALYWDEDITDAIASARPSLWGTFRYYLEDLDDAGGDKVMFETPANRGYAKLEDGAITFVKMP
ncbi:MAG: hypothetical protein R6V12_12820 [Candidatus Hydrogenedentota bacterium]